MAENKGFYDVYSYGDKVDPGNKLTIEHSIYISDENTDISKLTPLPLERLAMMKIESAAAEQAIFQKLQGATTEWDAQAAQTQLLDKAIEYVKVPAVQHTSNQWRKDDANYDRQTISNTVYAMSYHVYERTHYDQKAQKSVPVAWELTWGVYTNTPGNQRRQRIAGQDKKVYSDKADMEKYLTGRIKAYSNLFTEISPPVPQEYAHLFCVSGQLLPGYTIQGKEPKPSGRTTQEEPQRPAQSDHAADVTVGGDSISKEIQTEPRKERDNMHEPLNIQIVDRETYITRESGNAEAVPWLKLPATAEQFNAALALMGLQGREYGKDFFINGVQSPLTAIERIPLENIQKAGLDELNYLAAALQSRDNKQIDKLNAAAEMMTDKSDLHSLVELTQNTGVYDFHPDIFSNVQLGEHTLEHSGMIQIPDEWAGAIDIEMLGQLAAASEKGHFTEYGYIVPNGEEWKPITEIPQEYQITPKIKMPGREYEAVINNSSPAAATTAAPEQTKAKLSTIIPLNLASDNPRDKLKEITGKLEDGIKGIFESEQYKSYLKTLSKFHNYSMNNTILIAMQKPDASYVAGFNSWRDTFKRIVNKGEKGIKILAPAPFKTTKQVDALDGSGKPIIGKDGRHVKEEKEITVPAFKITTVFDVSQTDGQPLPQIGVSELAGNVDKYKEFYAALEKASPVPIGFEAIKTGAKGYYDQMEKRIAINEGMSELQSLKTAIHEIAHSRLHAIDTALPLRGQDIPDRRTREVEAESIAYTVCCHYGLDTSDYSFGYVATWSGDKQLDTLKSSLDTIRKEADAIITEVDKHLAELQQDKQQTAEKDALEHNAPGLSTLEQSAPVIGNRTEPGDTFTIYQLRPGDDMRGLRFEPFSKLEAAGLAVALANYDKVYAAPLELGATLDKIYHTFNIDKPEDFTGHSLSVSDVVVMNRDGKESAFYVNDKGFQELPNFLTAAAANVQAQEAQREVLRETPTPAVSHTAVNLVAVAGYMQKLNEGLQAVAPDSSMCAGAYNATVKRLELANERIPGEYPELKALITNAAQSPDFNTLKERMGTLQSEFTQHYSNTTQAAIDTGGKAQPPAPKPPAHGENVAAIEAQVKAGQAINLSDLASAIKADKQTAHSVQAPQSPASHGRGEYKKSAPTPDKAQNSRQSSQGRSAARAAAPEKPSIREQLRAGKEQIAAQKSAPARAAVKNKNAGLEA